jgi:hypothetical protein
MTFDEPADLILHGAKLTTLTAADFQDRSMSRLSKAGRTRVYYSLRMP